jgi:hypothetical protein
VGKRPDRWIFATLRSTVAQLQDGEWGTFAAPAAFCEPARSLLASRLAFSPSRSRIGGLDGAINDLMIWKVGKVQDIDIGPGFIPSPGFTVQQGGRSPSLTMSFEDLKTAEQCASSMREIIDRRRRSEAAINSSPRDELARISPIGVINGSCLSLNFWVLVEGALWLGHCRICFWQLAV